MLLHDKLKSNERVNDFISRIVKVSEQLKLIGKTPDDDELLLNGISAYPEYSIFSTYRLIKALHLLKRAL